MIIDNTVTNTVHEIFNVLEGLSYHDAKAALERATDVRQFRVWAKLSVNVL